MHRSCGTFFSFILENTDRKPTLTHKHFAFLSAFPVASLHSLCRHPIYLKCIVEHDSSVFPWLGLARTVQLLINKCHQVKQKPGRNFFCLSVRINLTLFRHDITHARWGYLGGQTFQTLLFQLGHNPGIMVSVNHRANLCKKKTRYV